MTSAASDVRSTNVRSWRINAPELVLGSVRTLSAVAPQLATDIAFGLFLRPFRYSPPARERDWVAEATKLKIPYGLGSLGALSWGDGPVALLVHGWSGRAAQMGALGTAFAAAGFRAVAIDLPAHGHSPGRRVSLMAAADAVGAAVRHLGPVDALVAHSFGAAASLYALQADLPVARVVLIAPSDAGEALRRYARMGGFDDAMRARLEQRLATRFGVPIERVSGPRLAGWLSLPGLVLHDQDDEVVPPLDARNIAASWKGSTLKLTQGLGHARILRDPDVLATVVAFARTPPVGVSPPPP